MPNNIYAPGAFIRIPLADRSYGYGRLLEFPYAAFYDLRTIDQISDLDEISAKPIIFILAVHKSIIETWEIIGQRPLEESMGQSFERFMQSPSDRSDCKIVDRAGNERPASPADCVGLERVAVWEPNHIEDRLLDTFMNRPNKWAESMKVIL
jgi:Immunity protein 26